MDLRRLRYFVQIVESGSLGTAATQLNVAQPALSKTIQALEEELETPLLYRSALGVMPTDAGHRLYEHCQIILQQVERAQIEVKKSGSKPLGRVVLGMPYSIVTVLALPLLKAVLSELPGVRLELRQDHSHVLAAQLRSGHLDIAVMARPKNLSGLTTVPLLIENLYFVERIDDTDPVTPSPLTFAEAAKRAYVLPSIANGLRSAVESYFRAHSVQLDVVQEIDAVSLILRCVEAGLGASVLPSGLVGLDPACKKLSVRTVEGGCYRLLVLCHSARSLAPAAPAIIALVERLTSQLVATNQWPGARST